MVIHNVSFGSYDDWDDQPQVPPQRVTASPPGLTTAPGSRFASMALDRGLLPVRLECSTAWSQQVGPHEVGRELAKAYEGAIVQLLASTVEANGGWPRRRLAHANAVSERVWLCVLLETSTWEQYQKVSRQLGAYDDFRVHGSIEVNGEPAVTVTANRTSVKSFEVASLWSGSADPWMLEGEILACAEQIRALRPKFEVRGDYSNYNDEELEVLHQQHRMRLSSELIGF